LSAERIVVSPQGQGRTPLIFKEKCAMMTAIADTARAFLEHGHPRLAFAAVVLLAFAAIGVAAILSN